MAWPNGLSMFEMVDTADVVIIKTERDGIRFRFYAHNVPRPRYKGRFIVSCYGPRQHWGRLGFIRTLRERDYKAALARFREIVREYGTAEWCGRCGSVPCLVHSVDCRKP